MLHGVLYPEVHVNGIKKKKGGPCQCQTVIGNVAWWWVSLDVVAWLGRVSELDRIEMNRTKREGSSMLKRLGSTYDSSSVRCTSFFVGWQRKRRREKEIALERLAHTQKARLKGVYFLEIDRESA